jgi:DNA replication protein DnaC
MKTYVAVATTEVTRMLDKATLNKLREMRLSAMAAKFVWQQEQPGIQSLSFEERFSMLIDAEWLAKHDRRIDRYIKQAEFRFPAVVEDIDYQEKRGITKHDILRLSDCSYIQRKQNVILSGPTGVGKTYLACSLGRCACQQGMAASYVRTSDLFLALEEAHATSSYISLRNRLAKVPLLILDDWGLKPFTMAESHEIMEIAERRYRNASTFISGQLPPSSWHELFPDPTLADAILDRLVHNAYKFNLTGESMRKTLALRQFADEDAGR